MSKIDCKSCNAACCKGVPLPANPNWSKDDIAWAETRGDITDGIWHIRSVCRHLDGKKCRIYADRPNACKVYPVGGESCIKARQAYGNNL